MLTKISRKNISIFAQKHSNETNFVVLDNNNFCISCKIGYFGFCMNFY